MALPFIELQKALNIRLSNYEPLTDLLGKDFEYGYNGIYDYVTEETPFPYIVIGEPLIDATQTVRIEDIVDETIVLHVWASQSKPNPDSFVHKGNMQVYKIINEIHNALKFKLKLENYDILGVRVRDPRVFEDLNEDLKHGVITMTYKLLKK